MRWETEVRDKLDVIAADGTLERVGFNPLIPEFHPFLWAAKAGLSLWDEASLKVTANQPEMVEIFNWVKEYGENYGAEEIQAFSTAYGEGDFGRNAPEGARYTGKVVTWPEHIYFVTRIEEYTPDMDFGVMPIPPFAGSDGYSGTIQSNMYLVPTGGKNSFGGFSFGSFMSTTPWVALNKVLPDGTMPTRMSVAHDPDVESVEAVQYWFKTVRDDIMPTALALPTMPAYSMYLSELVEAAQLVTFNDADPQEVLDGVVQRVQREVDSKLSS